jgi:hypothetical protein
MASSKLMLNSNIKENKNSNQSDKENKNDEYKLFSNLLKDKGENIKMVTSNIYKNQASKLYYYNNEYFDNANEKKIKIERP